MAKTFLLKTPIVYYGGKSSMLSELLPMVPDHQVYSEVFFGGGALFWAKKPVKNETINDRMKVVINLYRVLRTNYKSLKKMIDASLISRDIHKEALMILRKFEDKSSNKLQAAWAFWYVSNFSYNNCLDGYSKYSNDQRSSVPAVLKNKKEAFTELLVSRIENAYIENNDAVKILKSRNSPKAFHYIDPPYPGADQGHYQGYTTDDLKQVLDFLSQECKGLFLLSNYQSDLIHKYVNENGWNYRTIDYTLNERMKGKRHKTEVLVWNYQIYKDLFTQ